MSTSKIYKLRSKIVGLLFNSDFNTLDINFDKLGDCIHVELSTRKNENQAGMQLFYFFKENIFEVSEYQAGEKKGLFIYTETRSIKKAVKSLLLGNNRKPKRIY